MNRFPRSLSRAAVCLLIAATALLSACGGTSASAPPPPPPTVSLSASPTTVAAGSSATLTWSSSNASRVEIDNGIGVVPASGSVTVAPQQTTTYRALASGNGRTAQAFATVNVAGAVTLEFQALQETIAPGGSATLNWTAGNATEVRIEPGVGTFGPSGSVDVSPAATTTYSATASGAAGSVSKQATVNVATSAPTIIASAEPLTITASDLATLTWQSSNATSVTVTPAVSEHGIGLNGSASVGPTETTTYTFTATGPGGQAMAQVTVTVTHPEPGIELTVSPPSILAGESAKLSWTAEHATSIVIDHGIGSVEPPAGSVNVSPAATTTYTASVTGPGGSASASVTLTVFEPGAVGISLSVTPATITAGQSATLSWNSQNAVSVEIDQGIGAVNLSGTRSVSPSATVTYTAMARDSGGNTATAQATVTVIPPGGFQERIRHIIFYMQENRSFNQYFGMLGRYREMRGLDNNIDGLDLNVEMVDFHGHVVKPFKFVTACHDNTSPAWNESHFFRNRRNGVARMNRWLMQRTDSQGSTIDPHYTRAMGYYDWEALPYYYELATQFATSDRFFASMMGPTMPNRLYLFTGTSEGRIRPDPAGHPPYEMRTIFRQLTEAGILWRYYYHDSSVFLAQFRDWDDEVMRGRVRHINEYYEILSKPNADELLAPVVFLEQVAQDMLNEHPTNVWGLQPGVANTKKLMDALMNSSAWKSSVFLLMYDEAGGQYDHVPPVPMPHPDGIPPMFLDHDLKQDDTGGPYDFNESGFRIPFIVVSPWVKKNYVSHTPYDFGSVLKFIQTRFGLGHLTERDRNAGDMLEFFDFDNPSWMTPPPLPEQPYRNQVYVDRMFEKTGVRLEVDPAAMICNRNLGKDPNH